MTLDAARIENESTVEIMYRARGGGGLRNATKRSEDRFREAYKKRVFSSPHSRHVDVEKGQEHGLRLFSRDASKKFVSTAITIAAESSILYMNLEFGDFLVGINDFPVFSLPLDEVKDILQEAWGSGAPTLRLTVLRKLDLPKP